MTFTVESKSQLAKLLATENIAIEHQKISTAKFDPKNRVLYCPIWQDMSGALYDLLMGHEVGHALYTPAEGWHDAVSTKGQKFKGFLNVVEDARIEKKIKRRYPGIRTSFVKGYQSLLDRDFFGIKNEDVNELSFIDRLNVYTKSGGTLPVDFNPEETALLTAVESCETWEDVLRVTESVFDYSKSEQFETAKMLQSMSPSNYYDDDEFDDFDSDYDSDYDSENDSEEGEQNIGEKRDVDSNEKSEETKQSKTEADKTDNQNQKEKPNLNNEINWDKDSEISEGDFEPTCETDRSFRENENALLDAQCKPFVYATLPNPILKNILTPYKRVHEQLEKYWFKSSESVDRATAELKEFKSKNDRYIGLLAKEFEMKKAAKAYSKAKVSNTGDIDINKIYKYQIEDNIFKKMMKVPKGKSHGLILLLDRSGSMHHNMAGSIEQILVLTMFCRKVNIPFVVYGFGNSTDGRMSDFPNENIVSGFTKESGNIGMSHVFLREYMNSRMGNAEFNRCLRNMVRLKYSYESRFMHRPNSEQLANTPLNEAMVALIPLTNEFRKVNNLDLVNLVVVHDGDADNINYTWKADDKESNTGLYPSSFNAHSENVFVRDGKKSFQVSSKLDRWEALRDTIFKMYQVKTGAKIFGFFIAGQGRHLKSSLATKYFNKEGKSAYQIIESRDKNLPFRNYRTYEQSSFIEDLFKQIKNEKFIESFNPGYNAFFIIPGGTDLAIDDEELVINGAVTANKLKTAFMKMNKKKQVNRVMVSRFIDGIAA